MSNRPRLRGRTRPVVRPGRPAKDRSYQNVLEVHRVFRMAAGQAELNRQMIADHEAENASGAADAFEEPNAPMG